MLASVFVSSVAFAPLTRLHPPARRASVNMGLLEDLMGGSKGFDGPVVMGTEEMMSQKEYGTSAVPIQKDLRWSCDVETADRICNYNRHYAEYGGYWERATTFLKEESEASGEITFYDSNSGKPLFYGPRDRPWSAFVKESKVHGWPSFRDSEVNWDYVRVLPNGECISVDGTVRRPSRSPVSGAAPPLGSWLLRSRADSTRAVQHLGHNLPDGTGNRYCINLVSVAGKPLE
jgi:hypothetical protein